MTFDSDKSLDQLYLSFLYIFDSIAIVEITTAAGIIFQSSIYCFCGRKVTYKYTLN